MIGMPLHIPVQARKKESQFKPAEKQNEHFDVRFNTSLPAVHQLFIIGKTSALRLWLLKSVTTPICVCQPFSCTAYPVISK